MQTLPCMVHFICSNWIHFALSKWACYHIKYAIGKRATPKGWIHGAPLCRDCMSKGIENDECISNIFQWYHHGRAKEYHVHMLKCWILKGPWALNVMQRLSMLYTCKGPRSAKCMKMVLVSHFKEPGCIDCKHRPEGLRQVMIITL